MKIFCKSVQKLKYVQGGVFHFVSGIIGQFVGKLNLMYDWTMNRVCYFLEHFKLKNPGFKKAQVYVHEILFFESSKYDWVVCNISRFRYHIDIPTFIYYKIYWLPAQVFYYDVL